MGTVSLTYVLLLLPLTGSIIMTKIILKLIKFYQATLSPDHGPIFFGTSMRCRFYPSCSQYAYEAIERLGVSRGLFKASGRVFRCNPFSNGGIDPVRSLARDKIASPEDLGEATSNGIDQIK